MEKYILVANKLPISIKDKPNEFTTDGNYYFDFKEFHNERYGPQATISNQVLLAYIYFNYTSNNDVGYSNLIDKLRSYWVGHIICVGKYGNVGPYNLSGRGEWMGFEFNKIGGNITLTPRWKDDDNINRIVTNIPIGESEPDLYMKFTIL